MTIVVESWGLLKDSFAQKSLEKSLVKEFEKAEFKVQSGKTRYFGSTTMADLRELTNTRGDYGFFVDKKSVTTFKSIFNYKKEQGFETFAFHPFSGKMFSRSIWWKNLGATNIFFRDDYNIEHPLSNYNIDKQAHFPSVKDEIFFDYINEKSKTYSKRYVYYLTVNSHLPYIHKINDKYPDSSFNLKTLSISGEAINQLTHIKNFIIYVARHLSIYNWDKIVIVGDHRPPFYTKRERDFYQEGWVPYFILQKELASPITY